jgi:hypothetical protein
MAADASIVARIGGDATGLVAELEKGKAAVNAFGNIVSKSAKDSATAFKEFFAAGDRLAAQQARRTLENEAGFRSQIILQREVLALKKQVDAAEAGTIQKLELQIALEQKQLALEREIAGLRMTGGAAMTTSAARTGTAVAVATTKAGGLLGTLKKTFSAGNVLKGALGTGFGIGAAMLAPDIADSIARGVTGLSKKEEERLNNLIESTGKAADKQEADRDKAAEEADRKAQQRGEQKAREQEIYFQAIRDGLSMDEAAAKASAQAEEEAGFAADLEWVKEQDRIAAEKKLKAASIAELKDLEEKANKELQDQEQARIKEKFKSMADQWKGFLVSVTRTGRNDTELSDRELERKRENIKNDIFGMEKQSFETGAYQGGLYFQKKELEGVNQELALRQKVRSFTASFGEERAFKMLPGVSEQRFSEINNTSTQLDKISNTLEKFSQQFNKGIPVVYQGGDT